MAGPYVIACKHPNGLVLNCDQYQTDDRGNLLPVTRGRTVTLKGWAHKWGEPDVAGATGGYALTTLTGQDADLWDKWIARNADHPFIVERVILPPHKDPMHQARDHSAVDKMHAPAKIGAIPGVAKFETAA